MSTAKAENGHAIAGYLSYRCKGRLGRILIAAKSDVDAFREARRSTDVVKEMELLRDGAWVSVAEPMANG